MELLRMATGTQPRVCTVVRRLSSMLFKYQGYIGCALVLGGRDMCRPTYTCLYSIIQYKTIYIKYIYMSRVYNIVHNI